MIKKSMTIRGHRTSISLEHRFWDCLGFLAAQENLSVSALVAQIDDRRTQELMAGADTGGLSSMIRLYILEAALQGRLNETDLGR
jgi:predicted DNA-binding ribbon-helix-helix protein